MRIGIFRRTLLSTSSLIIPLMVLAILLLSVGSSSAAGFSGSGSGTAGDPYIITTVGQLQAMNDNKTAYYILGNDIDASATSGWNSGAGFIPIGTSATKFTGSFDGRGCKISNLYINRPSTDYIGLFGWVGSGGVVKNVGVESVTVVGNRLVGGLVGVNYGTVSHSYSTGTVSVGNLYGVGGLVGYNEGTVSNSYSTGAVSGNSDVGGLVGNNYGGTVSNSYSTGPVIGSGGYGDVGGLVGNNYGPVSNSYSTGSVSGTIYVGGLVGLNYEDGAGYGTVSNCYSTGTVSGGTYVGGLVGRNMGTVSNSFWDNQTSGWATSAGGTGKVTENMKYVRTFTDNTWSVGLKTPWDFVGNPYHDVGNENIWNIDSGINSGYPFLAWQVMQDYLTFTQKGLDSTAIGTVENLNGLLLTRDNLPYSIWVGNGTVENFTYSSIVSSTTSGKQFRLVSVSDSSPLTVTASKTVTANYVLQYKLTMAANFGGTSPSVGDSWYDEGTVVDISATAPSAGLGEQYVWNGWTGTGTISYTGADNPAIGDVTMNSAITETASWTHQYKLTMATNFGTTAPTAGDHWYNVGTVVDITATAPGGYVWHGWTGTGTISYTGTANPAVGDVTMNSAITETASWTHFSGSGSGTAGNPYIITTVEELQEMNDNKTAYYILGNDIDASATSGWNSGAGFVPIGTSTSRFTGSLDGRGYKIRNLCINRPSDSYIGLFGYVYIGAVIENVGLENENVIGGSYVGGLVGRNGDLWDKGGTISNCYSTGSVNGGGSSGGLAGLNCAIISSSYSAASVIGTNNVGGLVGNTAGHVSNCYSTGSVSYQIIGGYGGVAVGGLAGANGQDISNCYSTGPVSGIDRVGGLVGNNTGGVHNSFWDNQTSGQSTSGGILGYHGTGKTTENMKDVRTFTDNTWSTGLGTPWEFVGNPYHDVENENIWNIRSGINSGYPFLAWQVTLIFGVSVSISPGSQSGANGAVLTYTVTVTNNGNVSDNFSLTPSDDAGWSPSVLPMSIVIAAFSSDNATLSVTIPSLAIGGTTDNITVTANGTGDNASANCTATVDISRSVSVSISPGSQSGANGATLNYTVTVTTTGNVSDTYTLDNTDTLGWTPSLSNTSVVVPAFSSDSTTTLSVTILGTGIDNVTVTANGTGDSDNDSCIAQSTGVIYSLNMVAGWNLVCFPVTSENNTPENIFTGMTYFTDYIIYSWTAPGGPNALIGPNDVLQDNLGYWIYITSDQTITWGGSQPTSDNVYMVMGWNMVGFPIVNGSTTPSNIFTGMTYFTDYIIYSWTAPGGAYVLVGPGDLLLDNTGYWIYTTTDVMVTVP